MSTPDTAFVVRALNCVYPHVASDSATKGYLEELQNIASSSGKSIEEILQAELLKMKFGPSLAEPSPYSGEDLNTQMQQILKYMIAAQLTHQTDSCPQPNHRA